MSDDDKVVPFTLQTPMTDFTKLRQAEAGNPNVPIDIMQEIAANMPDGIPQMEIGNLGFQDMEAAFNMRGWLQKACEAQGAKMTGGGFGGGVADIDIELDGCHFNLTIKAL